MRQYNDFTNYYKKKIYNEKRYLDTNKFDPIFNDPNIYEVQEEKEQE